MTFPKPIMQMSKGSKPWRLPLSATCLWPFQKFHPQFMESHSDSLLWQNKDGDFKYPETQTDEEELARRLATSEKKACPEAKLGL